MTITQRVLGGTGIPVSAYCLGTMMLGQAGNPDHDEGIRMVHMALDAGITFVDTADMYSAGESEVIVGKALAQVGGRRDDVVLATKGHFALDDDRPDWGGNSRRYLRRALEASLRRLGVEWIDLYQVHRPDWNTDLEETLGVLTDLVGEGKIRAYGCSSYPAFELVEAARIAERRGLPRYRTEQPAYNLLARGVERDVLPVAQRLGMGVLTWSPLAFGFLTGRHRLGRPDTRETGRAMLAPRLFDPADPTVRAKLEAVEGLIEVAAELGVSLVALATAFPLAHPAVTSVILGPRTPEQLAGLLAGRHLVLEDGTLDRIDAVVPPGVNLYDPTAGSLTLPWLTEVDRRRRPRPLRAAALPRGVTAS